MISAKGSSCVWCIVRVYKVIRSKVVCWTALRDTPNPVVFTFTSGLCVYTYKAQICMYSYMRVSTRFLRIQIRRILSPRFCACRCECSPYFILVLADRSLVWRDFLSCWNLSCWNLSCWKRAYSGGKIANIEKLWANFKMNLAISLAKKFVREIRESIANALKHPVRSTSHWL